jgi:hypothetical protein
MPNTAKYGLPYPAQTDPPNGAAQLQALAARVDAALDGVVIAQDKRDDTQDSKIADLYAKVPTARVKWGSASVTTDSKGQASIAHAAGWVPSVVMLQPGISGTSLKGIGVTVDRDKITGTTVGIMAWNLDTGAPYVGGFTCYYIVRD